MGLLLCFWYDERTLNKAMCLFSNFHTNRTKIIEFIQYLSMKISWIWKNDFAIIILRWHPLQPKQYLAWWSHRRVSLYLAITTKFWANFNALTMKIIMIFPIVWSNKKIPLSWTLLVLIKYDFIDFIYE